MDKKINYIYLISAPHSGSTLFACLLGAHPEISTVGEFASVDKGRCSCGVLYSECPFWLTWKQLAEKQGLEFEIGNLKVNLGIEHNRGILYDIYYHLFPSKLLNITRDIIFKYIFKKYYYESNALIERSIKLINILLREENTKYFLDTTKNPIQVRFLARHPNINLKVISLIREGHAVMNSLIQKEKYSPIDAINNWIWSNKNIERVIEYYLKPEQVYKVKLEDFLENHQEVLKQIFKFLGVNPNVELDFNPKKRHVIGNYMRYTFDGTIRPPDNRWKRQLSPELIKLFDERAGDMNKKYGY